MSCGAPSAEACARVEVSAQPAPEVVACADCGLVQDAPPAARDPRCRRCDAFFGRRMKSVDTALALAATSIILFPLANLTPFLAIDIIGQGQGVRLGSGVSGLAEHGLAPLAAFVLVISVVAPLGRLLLLTWVLLLVRLGASRRQPHRRRSAWALRWAERLRPWSMLDVFLIGALISLAKLHALAQLEIGAGFWALGGLVAALAGFEAAIDRRSLWNAVSPPSPVEGASVVGCHHCGLVQPVGPSCLRCEAGLHRRKPESLHRATALMIAGLILYLPANIYPVMTVVSFGKRTTATILGGVVELMNGQDWPLALIVFAASVAVPLLKLVGLGWLLLSTRLRQREGLVNRTRLYRLIERVSRWSTVDVFVAGLLTALVALGDIATIEPGLGALAFGAVVLVTMVATECFDPRLMWDAAGANDV